MITGITGCSTMAKKMYSVKSPNFESYESQKTFLKDRDVDVQSYYYKDVSAYAQASKNKRIDIPNAYFFNKDGNFVSYKKSSTDCNANVGGFIADIKNFKNLEETDSFNIREVFSLTNIDSSEIATLSEINVVLTWAVFAGKVNDEKTFKWIQLLKQAQNEVVDVKYYLLNCDLQHNWNLSDMQKKLVEKKVKS